MRFWTALLPLCCACSTAVGASAVRTTSSAPPVTGPVAMRLTSDPPAAEQLGIVEAHGRRPAATLQEVLAQLAGQVAALGGDVARIDAFPTRYEMVDESYTYDCGTTQTRQEPQMVTTFDANGTPTTTTQWVTVTEYVAQTCTGVRQVEVATLTVQGRAFRTRKGTP
jgi:hypothetical protein